MTIAVQRLGGVVKSLEAVGVTPGIEGRRKRGVPTG